MIKREHMATHLVEYQLNMVGKTMGDVMADQMWRHNITLTQAQYLEFEKYALFQIQKTFKCNKSKAKQTLQWFNAELGLKVVPTPEERQTIINNLKQEGLWVELTLGHVPEENL